MPCPLRRAIVRVAIALLLFPYAALAQSPAPGPYWVQDGTAYAKVMWMSDGSWSDDAQQYVSPATKADAIVFFADGHSVSGSNSVSANVFAVGGAGSHAAWASGRANSTYYGFTPGNYLVSFSYTAGRVAMGVTQMNAEIGYETPTQRFSVSGEASGAYNAPLYLDQWISFYALADGSSPMGTASTSASILGISVTPLPVPEPDPAWMFAAGAALLAMVRRGRMARNPGPAD